MRCKSTRLARSFDSMKKRFLKIVIGIVLVCILSVGKMGNGEDKKVKTVCTDGTACNVGE